MRQFMTVMRQIEPGPGVSISSLAYDYPSGCTVPEHAHASDQLIYATRGVMKAAAEKSFWLIPPQFALWDSSQYQPQKFTCLELFTCALYIFDLALQKKCLTIAWLFASRLCSGS